jgi:hypothetical protein
MFRGEIEMTEKHPVPYSEGPVWLRTGFEPHMDVPPAFGENHNVPRNFAGQVEASPKTARNGARSVSLEGEASGDAVGSFPILDGQEIAITEDTWIRYFIHAGNEASTRTMLDIVATDGSRLSGQEGAGAYVGTCAGAPFGRSEEWTRVVVKIGQFMAGKTIRSAHLVYQGEGDSDIGVFIDDIMIFDAE